jgi:hypothetical protein
MTRPSISLCLVPLLSYANSICSGQLLPKIREIGPVTAVTTEKLSAVTTVRQLSDGRILVNDIVGRRLAMFDSSLSLIKVVADTSGATTRYGVYPGGLIAYRGDSTLFVDPGSLSMLVIGPRGEVARVMAPPQARDVGFLIGGPFGNPAFDSRGRLVYRAPPGFPKPPPASKKEPSPIPEPADSAALVGFNLSTRTSDTIVWFKIPKLRLSITKSKDGIRVLPTVNPLPQSDDWAVLADGTIALVRGKDFHIDWIGDSATISSPKIPFDWERITAEQKSAIIDSAKARIEKAIVNGQLNLTPDLARSNLEAAAASLTPPDSSHIDSTARNQIVMVDPTELPDYKPAFAPGSTFAEGATRLWIKTSQMVHGRPVYDVINREGLLVDRVQLPANRSLAGFGENGVIYLSVRAGRTAYLEKAHFN